MVHLTAGLCYVKEDLVLLVFYLFSFLDEELITLSKHEIVFFPPLFIFVGLLFLHRPQTGGGKSHYNTYSPGFSFCHFPCESRGSFLIIDLCYCVR